MIAGRGHRRYAQILIAELGVANSLRILATGRLRTAGAIHCKRATRTARWIFGRRIVSIPDHSYTPVADGYFISVLNDRLVDITNDAFDEPDRYIKRFLEMGMATDLNGSVALGLDYEILAAGLDGDTCLLVPWSPFLDVLRRRYDGGGLAIGWCFPGAALRQSARTFGVACAKTLRGAARWVRHGRSTPGGERTTPKVSVVCHRGGQALSLRSDLFWLSPGRPYPNVIAELRTSLYPFSEAMIDELAQREIVVVETHGRRRLSTRALYWQPGAGFVVGFLKSVAGLAHRLVKERRMSPGLRWWRFVQELRFNLFLHERLDYCRTFNVKAEMKLGMLVTEPAHSSALAQVGGITVTQQYSVSIYFGISTSTSTIHLYFGRRSGEIKAPLLADVSLLNGYVFTRNLLASEDVVRQLRLTLERQGVERSVCFFEENPAPEFRARFILPVYRYLMEKVLADPSFGVLIKPKKDSTVAVLEREIGPLFDRARQTGRFVMLRWHNYPGVVAQAVDLATGVLGTSTLEAVVVGSRTLHFNPRGALPLFFQGAESNIFETVDTFTAAVDAFFRPDSNDAIGRHSADFREGVDHYGDGLAGERMEYLGLGYVGELEKRATPQEALARTLAGFDARWGLCELRPARTGRHARRQSPSVTRSVHAQQGGHV